MENQSQPINSCSACVFPLFFLVVFLDKRVQSQLSQYGNSIITFALVTSMANFEQDLSFYILEVN